MLRLNTIYYKREKNMNGLLSELKRFARASKAGDFNGILSDACLSGEEAEAVRLINEILSNYRDAKELDILKLKQDMENATIRDFHKYNKMIQDIEYRDNLLEAVNHAAELLLTLDMESFEDVVFHSMQEMAKAIKADRMYIWKNDLVDGRLCHTQLYEWSGGAEPQQDKEYTVDLPYSDISPEWEELLSGGVCINGLVRDRSSQEQAIFSSQGILSFVVVPIFIGDRFWGIVGIDDCHNEREYTKNEESMLRSGGFLIASAILRNEMLLDIRDASERATEASKAKSNFLSNMSHEMRTPMNAIIGMTSIGKKADDIEQKNRALNKIGDASSHLLGIINDILDMAKIEANKLELVPTEFNFERMLQKVLTVIHYRADEKQQQLNLNIDENIPRFLIGDDQRLAQVITNLLSNAVKFTPEGGEICMDASLVSETDDNCELRIEIADNGIGIPPEKHEKLFRAFEQAESGISRKYGGTGLGLVISKRIIELMGGKIWVESEFGKGARFIFHIKAARSNKSPFSMLAPGVNWKNVRILAVDDMAEIRDQIQEIFAQLDIDCDVAADGLDACQIIEERGAYDIYFIDWRMPGMNGIELTKKIKKITANKPSVVIMITAMDWEQIKDEALQAGVNKCLLKPMLSSMVIDCVNESLGIPDASDDENHIIAGEFSGKTLLIAEDIEINREILIAFLEDTGLVIDCAENGKEALDMIASAPAKYDIVLMDVQMPIMNGFEATQHIRSLPQCEKLPIIALTANVFKSDIEECLLAGMDDHLGKPLDIDKVLEKLRLYLSPTQYQV